MFLLKSLSIVIRVYVGLEPQQGMSLEILDPDLIWSSATVESIVCQEDDNNKQVVNIRYEGWGAEWDEQLSWPNERLAKLFTYTKRVKCLASILPMKKDRKKTKAQQQTSISSTLWPCCVSFRMPHSSSAEPKNDDNDSIAAVSTPEEALKLECNVYVQPYCKNLLPSFLCHKFGQNDGMWINVNKLKKWRGDIFASKALDESSAFEVAYNYAMQDPTTVGTFPGSSQCIESGSLLKEEYRAKTIEGVIFNGGLYSGDLIESPLFKTKKASATDDTSFEQTPEAQHRTDLDELHDPSPYNDNSSSSNRANVIMPKYEPPPTLPEPITIHEPVYSDGLTRLTKSKQWGASLRLGGNTLLLGPFPTQTQATRAVKLASCNKDNVLLDTNNIKNTKHSYVEDMQQMNLERSIAALKEACLQRHQSLNTKTYLSNNVTNLTSTTIFPHLNQIAGSFSLHNWTMQQIRHQGYLGQLRQSYNSEEKCIQENSKNIPSVLAGSKRKSIPRKVDIVKRAYVPN